MGTDGSKEATVVGNERHTDNFEIVESIRTEIDKFRTKGDLLRHLGTGSAIVGGAASLVPAAFLLPVGIGFIPWVGAITGLGAASLAIIEQKKRDGRLLDWENRLEAILSSKSGADQSGYLQILADEIFTANA